MLWRCKVTVHVFMVKAQKISQICPRIPYVEVQIFWPQGYKKCSCSTQLSMIFFQLINVKMPTIVLKCQQLLAF